MMDARTIMLTTLGGGMLMGVTLGLTTNTAMLPSPQPSWRQAPPVHPAPAYASQVVDNRPQDLSPTWYLDRMPTWKRRALEQAGYTIDDLGYPVPPEPSPATYDPPPGPPQEPRSLAIEPRGEAPLDAAATKADLAERHAQAPTASDVQPAAQEAESSALSVVTPDEAGA